MQRKNSQTTNKSHGVVVRLLHVLFKNPAPLLLALTLPLMLLTACSNNRHPMTYAPERRVIIDADVAADDALSIMLMAKAPNITIEGIVALAGNVDLDQACDNALMTLEVAGADHIPVYRGSTTRFNGQPIEDFSVFGADGMGDNDLIHPTGKPQDQDGIDFILKTVAESPGEIEILATGPMTDIAKAIQQDPQTMSQVKRIYSMGTCGTKVQGNATPLAEFNVYMDTLAYEYVIDSGIPITIIGYDVCGTEAMLVGDKELENIGKAGSCGAYISKALEGLLAYDKGNGLEKTMVCDPIAAAAIIWSDFVTESKPCHAEIITEEGPTKGAVLFYIKGFYYEGANVDEWHCDVVTRLNDNVYLENVLELLKR